MQMDEKKSHIKKIIIVTEKESAKFTKNQKMNKLEVILSLFHKR